MSFDVLIRGARLFDGSGAPPRDADVGVRGDRIEAVGALGDAIATREIDATGLVVAPGFIDAHTHSDLAYLHAPGDVAVAPVRQGVTSEVCGNCGFSPFPYAHGHDADLERHVAALLGGAVGWSDLDGWRRAIAEAGLYSNLASLVGHGSLRAGVLGFENRAARDDEVVTMVDLAEACFEQGAVGFSTGLIYTPGAFAEMDELTSLCRALARYGRPYTTHIRGETHMVAEAVEEAITIGRLAGVPIHISHHKAAGRANWGRTHETLRLVERARADGIDVTLDVYPYTAASTLLYANLPRWLLEGGPAAMLTRLDARDTRDRLRADVAEGIPGWENMPRAAGWEGIVVSSCPGEPEAEGQSIAALAEAEREDPIDTVADLLLRTGGNVIVVMHVMAEEDVRNVLGFDGSMIGSDGIPLPGKPHPRLAGTFARVLGHYCREEASMGLAEAIRKMTSQPADRFDLADRGRLAEGCVADIVLFDPSTVSDRASFSEPLLPPEGVASVFVNGQEVVADGELTGRRPGRILGPG